MASSKNCQVISLRRAPMALRTPISRVRSVTETSMMFMTPMPPTSRPMERDHHHDQRHCADNLVKLGDHGLGRGHRRSCRARRGFHVAAAAEHAADLVAGLPRPSAAVGQDAEKLSLQLG